MVSQSQSSLAVRGCSCPQQTCHHWAAGACSGSSFVSPAPPSELPAAPGLLTAPCTLNRPPTPQQTGLPACTGHILVLHHVSTGYMYTVHVPLHLEVSQHMLVLHYQLALHGSLSGTLRIKSNTCTLYMYMYIHVCVGHSQESVLIMCTCMYCTHTVFSPFQRVVS